MILVTGASGLLGSYLVEYLSEIAATPIKLLLRNENQKSQFKDLKNVQYSIGDINDISSLEEAFENIEYVFHCAGLISFSPFDKEKLEKINIEGTANIVNMCLWHKVKKLCHVSSVAAIGKSKDGLVSNEEVQWDESDDNSFYGKTKYLGELEVWRGIEEGLNAVIVNPSVIIGPTSWSRSSMKLFDYVKKGNRFYTQGGNNFVDVRDVVELMHKLLFSDISSERYIIAGERITYKKLFELIATALKVKPPYIMAKKWMIDVLRCFSYVKSLITKKHPLITKETSKVSLRKHEYSSQKIISLLDYTFTSMEKTIPWTVEKLK